MDKLAIFVEGQTEQIFVEKLMIAIAGQHQVHIDTVRAHGGRLAPRQFLEVEATRPQPEKKYVTVHRVKPRKTLGFLTDYR